MVFLVTKAALAATLVGLGVTFGALSYFARKGQENNGQFNSNSNKGFELSFPAKDSSSFQISSSAGHSSPGFNLFGVPIDCNCKVITECASLAQGNRAPFSFRLGRTCGFQGFQRKVCCDEVQFFSTPPPHFALDEMRTMHAQLGTTTTPVPCVHNHKDGDITGCSCDHSFPFDGSSSNEKGHQVGKPGDDNNEHGTAGHQDQTTITGSGDVTTSSGPHDDGPHTTPGSTTEPDPTSTTTKRSKLSFPALSEYFPSDPEEDVTTPSSSGGPSQSIDALFPDSGDSKGRSGGILDAFGEGGDAKSSTTEAATTRGPRKEFPSLNEYFPDDTASSDVSKSLASLGSSTTSSTEGPSSSSEISDGGDAAITTTTTGTHDVEEVVTTETPTLANNVSSSTHVMMVEMITSISVNNNGEDGSSDGEGGTTSQTPMQIGNVSSSTSISVATSSPATAHDFPDVTETIVHGGGVQIPQSLELDRSKAESEHSTEAPTESDVITTTIGPIAGGGFATTSGNGDATTPIIEAITESTSDGTTSTSSSSSTLEEEVHTTTERITEMGKGDEQLTTALPGVTSEGTLGINETKVKTLEDAFGQSGTPTEASSTEMSIATPETNRPTTEAVTDSEGGRTESPELSTGRPPASGEEPLMTTTKPEATTSTNFVPAEKDESTVKPENNAMPTGSSSNRQPLSLDSDPIEQTTTSSPDTTSSMSTLLEGDEQSPTTTEGDELKLTPIPTTMTTLPPTGSTSTLSQGMSSATDSSMTTPSITDSSMTTPSSSVSTDRESPSTTTPQSGADMETTVLPAENLMKDSDSSLSTTTAEPLILASGAPSTTVFPRDDDTTEGVTHGMVASTLPTNTATTDGTTTTQSNQINDEVMSTISPVKDTTTKSPSSSDTKNEQIEQTTISNLDAESSMSPMLDANEQITTAPPPTMTSTSVTLESDVPTTIPSVTESSMTTPPSSELSGRESLGTTTTPSGMELETEQTINMTKVEPAITTPFPITTTEFSTQDGIGNTTPNVLTSTLGSDNLTFVTTEDSVVTTTASPTTPETQEVKDQNMSTGIPTSETTTEFSRESDIEPTTPSMMMTTTVPPKSTTIAQDHTLAKTQQISEGVTTNNIPVMETTTQFSGDDAETTPPPGLTGTFTTTSATIADASTTPAVQQNNDQDGSTRIPIRETTTQSSRDPDVVVPSSGANPPTTTPGAIEVDGTTTPETRENSDESGSTIIPPSETTTPSSSDDAQLTNVPLAEGIVTTKSPAMPDDSTTAIMAQKDGDEVKETTTQSSRDEVETTIPSSSSENPLTTTSAAVADATTTPESRQVNDQGITTIIPINETTAASFREDTVSTTQSYLSSTPSSKSTDNVEDIPTTTPESVDDQGVTTSIPFKESTTQPTGDEGKTTTPSLSESIITTLSGLMAKLTTTLEPPQSNDEGMSTIAPINEATTTQPTRPGGEATTDSLSESMPTTKATTINEDNTTPIAQQVDEEGMSTITPVKDFTTQPSRDGTDATTPTSPSESVSTTKSTVSTKDNTTPMGRQVDDEGMMTTIIPVRETTTQSSKNDGETTTNTLIENSLTTKSTVIKEDSTTPMTGQVGDEGVTTISPVKDATTQPSRDESDATTPTLNESTLSTLSTSTAKDTSTTQPPQSNADEDMTTTDPVKEITTLSPRDDVSATTSTEKTTAESRNTTTETLEDDDDDKTVFHELPAPVDKITESPGSITTTTEVTSADEQIGSTTTTPVSSTSKEDETGWTTTISSLIDDIASMLTARTSRPGGDDVVISDRPPTDESTTIRTTTSTISASTMDGDGVTTGAPEQKTALSTGDETTTVESVTVKESTSISSASAPEGSQIDTENLKTTTTELPSEVQPEVTTIRPEEGTSSIPPSTSSSTESSITTEKEGEMGEPVTTDDSGTTEMPTTTTAKPDTSSVSEIPNVTTQSSATLPMDATTTSSSTSMADEIEGNSVTTTESNEVTAGTLKIIELPQTTPSSPSTTSTSITTESTVTTTSPISSDDAAAVTTTVSSGVTEDNNEAGKRITTSPMSDLPEGTTTKDEGEASTTVNPIIKGEVDGITLPGMTTPADFDMSSMFQEMSTTQGKMVESSTSSSSSSPVSQMQTTLSPTDDMDMTTMSSSSVMKAITDLFQDSTMKDEGEMSTTTKSIPKEEESEVMTTPAMTPAESKTTTASPLNFDMTSLFQEISTTEGKAVESSTGSSTSPVSQTEATSITTTMSSDSGDATTMSLTSDMTVDNASGSGTTTPPAISDMAPETTMKEDGGGMMSASTNSNSTSLEHSTPTIPPEKATTSGSSAGSPDDAEGEGGWTTTLSSLIDNIATMLTARTPRPGQDGVVISDRTPSDEMMKPTTISPDETTTMMSTMENEAASVGAMTTESGVATSPSTSKVSGGVTTSEVPQTSPPEIETSSDDLVTTTTGSIETSPPAIMSSTQTPQESTPMSRPETTTVGGDGDERPTPDEDNATTEKSSDDVAKMSDSQGEPDATTSPSTITTESSKISTTPEPKKVTSEAPDTETTTLFSMPVGEIRNEEGTPISLGERTSTTTTVPDITTVFPDADGKVPSAITESDVPGESSTTVKQGADRELEQSSNAPTRPSVFSTESGMDITTLFQESSESTTSKGEDKAEEDTMGDKSPSVTTENVLMETSETPIKSTTTEGPRPLETTMSAQRETSEMVLGETTLSPSSSENPLTTTSAATADGTPTLESRQTNDENGSTISPLSEITTQSSRDDAEATTIVPLSVGIVTTKSPAVSDDSTTPMAQQVDKEGASAIIPIRQTTTELSKEDIYTTTSASNTPSTQSTVTADDNTTPMSQKDGDEGVTNKETTTQSSRDDVETTIIPSSSRTTSAAMADDGTTTPESRQVNDQDGTTIVPIREMTDAFPSEETPATSPTLLSSTPSTSSMSPLGADDSSTPGNQQLDGESTMIPVKETTTQFSREDAESTTTRTTPETPEFDAEGMSTIIPVKDPTTTQSSSDGGESESTTLSLSEKVSTTKSSGMHEGSTTPKTGQINVEDGSTSIPMMETTTQYLSEETPTTLSPMLTQSSTLSPSSTVHTHDNTTPMSLEGDDKRGSTVISDGETTTQSSRAAVDVTTPSLSQTTISTLSESSAKLTTTLEPPQSNDEGMSTTIPVKEATTQSSEDNANATTPGVRDSELTNKSAGTTNDNTTPMAQPDDDEKRGSTIIPVTDTTTQSYRDDSDATTTPSLTESALSTSSAATTGDTITHEPMQSKDESVSTILPTKEATTQSSRDLGETTVSSLSENPLTTTTAAVADATTTPESRQVNEEDGTTIIPIKDTTAASFGEDIVSTTQSLSSTPATKSTDNTDDNPTTTPESVDDQGVTTIMSAKESTTSSDVGETTTPSLSESIITTLSGLMAKLTTTLEPPQSHDEGMSTIAPINEATTTQPTRPGGEATTDSLSESMPTTKATTINEDNTTPIAQQVDEEGMSTIPPVKDFTTQPSRDGTDATTPTSPSESVSTTKSTVSTKDNTTSMSQQVDEGMTTIIPVRETTTQSSRDDGETTTTTLIKNAEVTTKSTPSNEDNTTSTSQQVGDERASTISPVKDTTTQPSWDDSADPTTSSLSESTLSTLSTLNVKDITTAQSPQSSNEDMITMIPAKESTTQSSVTDLDVTTAPALSELTTQSAELSEDNTTPNAQQVDTGKQSVSTINTIKQSTTQFSRDDVDVTTSSPSESPFRTLSSAMTDDNTTPIGPQVDDDDMSRSPVKETTTQDSTLSNDEGMSTMQPDKEDVTESSTKHTDTTTPAMSESTAFTSTAAVSDEVTTLEPPQRTDESMPDKEVTTQSSGDDGEATTPPGLTTTDSTKSAAMADASTTPAIQKINDQDGSTIIPIRETTTEYAKEDMYTTTQAVSSSTPVGRHVDEGMSTIIPVRETTTQSIDMDDGEVTTNNLSESMLTTMSTAINEDNTTPMAQQVGDEVVSTISVVKDTTTQPSSDDSETTTPSLSENKLSMGKDATTPPQKNDDDMSTMQPDKEDVTDPSRQHTDATAPSLLENRSTDKPEVMDNENTTSMAQQGDDERGSTVLPVKETTTQSSEDGVGATTPILLENALTTTSVAMTNETTTHAHEPPQNNDEGVSTISSVDEISTQFNRDDIDMTTLPGLTSTIKSIDLANDTTTPRTQQISRDPGLSTIVPIPESTTESSEDDFDTTTPGLFVNALTNESVTRVEDSSMHETTTEDMLQDMMMVVDDKLFVSDATSNETHASYGSTTEYPDASTVIPGDNVESVKASTPSAVPDQTTLSVDEIMWPITEITKSVRREPDTDKTVVELASMRSRVRTKVVKTVHAVKTASEKTISELTTEGTSTTTGSYSTPPTSLAPYGPGDATERSTLLPPKMMDETIQTTTLTMDTPDDMENGTVTESAVTTESGAAAVTVMTLEPGASNTTEPDVIFEEGDMMMDLMNGTTEADVVLMIRNETTMFDTTLATMQLEMDNTTEIVDETDRPTDSTPADMMTITTDNVTSTPASDTTELPVSKMDDVTRYYDMENATEASNNKTTTPVVETTSYIPVDGLQGTSMSSVHESDGTHETEVVITGRPDISGKPMKMATSTEESGEMTTELPIQSTTAKPTVTTFMPMTTERVSRTTSSNVGTEVGPTKESDSVTTDVESSRKQKEFHVPVQVIYDTVQVPLHVILVPVIVNVSKVVTTERPEMELNQTTVIPDTSPKVQMSTMPPTVDTNTDLVFDELTTSTSTETSTLVDVMEASTTETPTSIPNTLNTTSESGAVYDEIYESLFGPSPRNVPSASNSESSEDVTSTTIRTTTTAEPAFTVEVKVGPHDSRSLFSSGSTAAEKQLEGEISNVVSQLLLTTHKNFHLLPSFVECAGARGRGRRKTRVLHFDTDNYPWMARVGFKEKGAVIFPCAGTIISRRYVLTSANCAMGRNNASDLSAMEILLEGAKNAAAGQSYQLRYKYKVEEIIPHPNYDPKSRENDIAVIRLSAEIPFNTSTEIKPICLPFEDGYGVWDSLPKEGETAYLGGWGYGLRNMAAQIEVMEQAAVTIWSNENCTYLYRGDRAKRITPRNICAYGKPEKDSCRGDNGGPLMALMTRQKIFFQIAVVSYGPRCGYGVPAVYTRTSPYLSWILDSIEP